MSDPRPGPAPGEALKRLVVEWRFNTIPALHVVFIDPATGKSMMSSLTDETESNTEISKASAATRTPDPGATMNLRSQPDRQAASTIVYLDQRGLVKHIEFRDRKGRLRRRVKRGRSD